jgi:hypothetical protein
MTETILTQNKLKKIEDLTLREIDMTYSLSRCGWSYRDIGRKYGISENDAMTVATNYVEVRKACERKPPEQCPNRNPEPVANKRKRRRDAIYATAKDRQAAYRARLKERSQATIEESSRVSVADEARSADEKPSVTLCERTMAETKPESPDPQRSIPDSSSNEGYGNVGSMPVPVTSEGLAKAASCAQSRKRRNERSGQEYQVHPKMAAGPSNNCNNVSGPYPAKDPFLARVLKRPKLSVVGMHDDLEKTAG